MSGSFTEPVDSGDPFFPALRPSNGWPPAERLPDGVLDRLPALYRRDPGALLPLLKALLETVAGPGAESRAAARPFGRRRPAEDLSGSNRGLVEYLAREGPPPAVFPAMAVRAVEGSAELEMVRSDVPAVVIGWPPGTGPARADPSRIPGGLVPPGVKLYSVRLTGEPPRGGISGERFQGELVH